MLLSSSSSSSSAVLIRGGGCCRVRALLMSSSPPSSSLWHTKQPSIVRFSTTTATTTRRPVRPTNITSEERAAIRTARKERANEALQRAQGGVGGGGAGAGTTTTTTTTKSTSKLFNPKYSRWMWYAGLGLPTIFITWGIYDEKSPPAQLAKAIGLADLIGTYTSQISAPVYDKLLPDWADVSGKKKKTKKTNRIPNSPHSRLSAFLQVVTCTHRSCYFFFIFFFIFFFFFLRLLLHLPNI